MKITANLFAASLQCPTKCWLRAANETATGNAYAQWNAERSDRYRVEGIKRLSAERGEHERLVTPAVETIKSGAWLLAVDVSVQSAGVESRIAAIERVPSAGRGRAAQFVPIRFAWSNKLGPHEKLLLAFDALALAETLGRDVPVGKIIHGDDHATLSVKLPALVNEVRKLIEKATALLSNPSPPDLGLNRHCAECEFQVRCRQKAIEKDDLSLLAGMTEKERKKFHSKGIFTVTQLSYTFRPRRRPKRLRDRREKESTCNIVSAIFARVYFPVFSNGLKDIAGWLDFTWPEGLKAGTETIAWREHWTERPTPEAKLRITRYNACDCEALELVTNTLLGMQQSKPGAQRGRTFWTSDR